ncbi:MAG: ExbD/TolR family protein [Gemmatimonadota bacterium]
MRRSFRREEPSGGGMPVRAEISVTSLVDVAFTLLIIFMITAPILQGGVEITVPRAPARPLETTEGVTITVDDDGQVYLGEAPVSMDEFDATVVQAIRREGSPTVYVRGDAEVGYGRVLQVIGRLKEADVDNVSLVAEPENGEGGS